MPHRFLRGLQNWGTSPLAGGAPVEVWSTVVQGAGWWVSVPGAEPPGINSQACEEPLKGTEAHFFSSESLIIVLLLSSTCTQTGWPYNDPCSSCTTH